MLINSNRDKLIKADSELDNSQLEDSFTGVEIVHRATYFL